MNSPEALTVGVTVLALTDKGDAAASARDASMLFATWFISNLSQSHPITLTFARGRLFELRLLIDGVAVWSSPPPAEGDDLIQTVGPGGQFTIPINPPPVGLPDQSPVVPLKTILDDLAIPADRELDLEFSAMIGPQAQVTTLWLWRA